MTFHFYKIVIACFPICSHAFSNSARGTAKRGLFLEDHLRIQSFDRIQLLLHYAQNM